MPSVEVLREIRLWFDDQPIMAQALISIFFVGFMTLMGLRYLTSRDKEISSAAASNLKAVETLQEGQRWMVETHVEQLKELSHHMRESLRQLSEAINRSHTEQLRELQRTTEHLVQDSIRSVDRSSAAVERFSEELRRHQMGMLS